MYWSINFLWFLIFFIFLFWFKQIIFLNVSLWFIKVKKNNVGGLFQLRGYYKSFVYVYTMEIMSLVMIHHRFLLSNNQVGNIFSWASSECCSFISVHRLVHRPYKRWDPVNAPDPLCSYRLPLWYCDHKQFTRGGILVLMVRNY